MSFLDGARQAAEQAPAAASQGVHDLSTPEVKAQMLKATALQEKANRSLQIKESAYRIGEIQITATIPPQIGFSIVRIGDPEDESNQIQASGDLLHSVETADEEVVSLSGEVEPIQPQG